MTSSISVIRDDLRLRRDYFQYAILALHKEFEEVQDQLGADWKPKKAWKKKAGFSFMQKELDAALRLFQMSLVGCRTKNGEVVDSVMRIDYGSEYALEEREILLLERLAHLLEPGSHVIFYADGSMWRYVVRGDRLFYQDSHAILWSDSSRRPHGGNIDLNNPRNASRQLGKILTNINK